MRAIRRGFLFLTLLTLVSGLLAQQSSTTVPNLVRYGGVLKDVQGAAMASRTVGITFLIYGQQDGGAPVWMETQNVATDAAGQYNVLLGSTTAIGLPGDLFAQQEQRWLAVKAEGQPEQPRVLLVSVPYAFKAHEAEMLSGHQASEFVTTDSLRSTVQLLQQNTPSSSGTITNVPTASIVLAPAATTDTATNFVDTTTNQVVLVQQNGTGVALSATAGGNSAVTGKSTSGTVAAVAGTSSSATGTGVSGTASSTTGVNYGVKGQSSSTGGIGVRGLATALTGAAVGLLGSSSSTSGTGVSAADSATSGATVGLKAQVSSASGIAAILQNTASGKLISARTGTGVGTEKFGVDGSGNMTTSGAVTSTGNMSGNRLISRVATGTAPLLVTSTTLVPNLNASLLGGRAATAFALANGSPNYIQNGTSLQGFASFNIDGDASVGGWVSAASFVSRGSTVMTIGNPSDFNLFLGEGAGFSYQSGEAAQNVFAGYQAGYSNVTGVSNTFSGFWAGYSNVTGGGNTFIGASAGLLNTTGNNDIYIGTSGPISGSESSTIRIGEPGIQSAAYIAGIYGVNIGSGTTVFINSNGQLGTLTSSRRFKEQIRDMGDSTSALMKLRPVTFLYKPEYDKGERTLQYGLIAEEVAEIYPDLVAYEPDGKPYTVKYQYLTTMLLNEMQKQYHRVDEQADVIKAQQQDVKAQSEVIKTQQQEIDSLKAQLRLQNAAFQERLSRLESMVGTQTQIAADLSHQ